MEYNDKVEKFNSKNGRQYFNEKTLIDDLPLRLELGSSSHHPDMTGGFTTCDIKLWCKFSDREWFMPYTFNREQILSFIEICSNDGEIISLMRLLAAKI